MKHLIYLFLALPVLLAAGNLLPDASFELGGADYAKLRFTRPMRPEEVKYLPPVADRTTKIHGSQSLRFDNPAAEPSVLRSPDFNVTPGKPYTLSFYAKSSKPVKLRYLPLSIIPAEKNGRAGRDWFNPARTITLSTEWKRYTCTFLPPKGHKSFLLDFLWGENNDATVWFDALQVEPGTETTPFSPKSDLEFTLTAPRHLHIDGEQPLTCTLTGINYGKTAKTVKFLFYDRNDYTGEKLAERSGELTVPAGKTASETFSVPVRPYGVYSTGACFTLNGKPEQLLPFLYAFSGRYTPKPFHPDRDFVLGVEEGFNFGYPDLNGGKTFFLLPESDEAEYHRINRNQGYRFLRIGNGSYRIFEWATVEPEQGKFDFEWLADAADFLGRHGVYTILGTPTAAPPAWIIEQNPEILPVNSNGQRMSFGGRHHDCQSNRTYREHIRRFVTAMAERFKDHPYVIGWQIDNELGNSHEDLCMCDSCQKAFQEWLQKKYHTMECLNKEWGTGFWSQDYDRFDQIPVPRKTPTVHNPSLLLDFKRFCSDLVVDFQNFQIDLIRQIAPYQKITHNMMGFYDKTDYYKLAEKLDFASNDQYPTGYYIDPPGEKPYQVAACMDLIRSLKKQNFWMMEMESGPTGGAIIGANPRPGQNRLWTVQSVAHGADTVVYFRWRTCLFGTEQFWHGILPHNGIPLSLIHI